MICQQMDANRIKGVRIKPCEFEGESFLGKVCKWEEFDARRATLVEQHFPFSLYRNGIQTGQLNYCQRVLFQRVG